MLKNYQKTMKNLFDYKWYYLSTGLVFQLVFGVVAKWGLKRLFTLMLLLTGQENLSNANFSQVLANPLGTITLLFYVIALTACLYLEYAGFCLMIASTMVKKQVSWRLALGLKWSQLPKLVPNGCYFLLYMILTVPLANLGLSTSLTKALYIPEFITGEWSKSTTSTLGLVLLGIILCYLTFRLLYVIPLFVLGQYDFPKVLLISWKQTKGKMLSLILQFTLVEASLMLLLLPIYLLLLMLALWLDTVGTHLMIEGLLLTAVNSCLFVLNLFLKIGMLHVLVGQISIDWERLSLKPLKFKWMSYQWLLLGVTFLGLWLQESQQLKVLQYHPSIQIVGHRGYVKKAVENSLQGLRAAKRYQANAVEADVLYTRDHQFVVIHDDHLKRLAGKNQQVSEMSASDVCNLKLKQGEYHSQIVSLDSFLAEAERLKMNVILELKPTGKEDSQYVPSFIQLLAQKGLSIQIKVMSLDLETIRQVERLAPQLETGYVIPIQFGNPPKVDVDFYAIEDFSYHPKLAKTIHEEGKQLYVWTVNAADKVHFYLQSPIDGLITDELEIVQTTKKALSEEGGYFDRLIDLVQPIQ